MKHILFAICLAAASPAVAQNQNLEEGAEAFSRGMELLLEGLMQELTPRIDELRDMLNELDAYHAPEILENGDILIRRKTPEEIEADKGTEIEL